MGIFTRKQKDTAENIYEKNIKKNLKKKDGFIHVLLINSNNGVLKYEFECDDKYTTYIDTVISAMQSDGYEIVDIKFQRHSPRISHTLVMYK